MIDPLHPWDLTRIVVAVDPAVTSGEDADLTGIIVAGRGRGRDGDGYVLDDQTCHESPDGWARRVKFAYDRWQADRVIAEANNGGELVSTVLNTVDSSMAITLVHAARGKQTRAEPVAALYEQGRVHHVGASPSSRTSCASGCRARARARTGWTPAWSRERWWLRPTARRRSSGSGLVTWCARGRVGGACSRLA